MDFPADLPADFPAPAHPHPHPHGGWPGNELEEVLSASLGVPSAIPAPTPLAYDPIDGRRCRADGAYRGQ